MIDYILYYLTIKEMQVVLVNIVTAKAFNKIEGIKKGLLKN